MAKIWFHLVNWFLHPSFRIEGRSLRSQELVRKARLMSGFSIVGIVLVLVMYGGRIWIEGPYGSPAIFVLPVLAMLLAANLGLLRYTRYVTWTVYQSIFIVLCIIPFRAYHTGGLFSPSITWYLTMPIVAALLLSTRATILVAGISGIQMYLLAHPEFLGLTAPETHQHGLSYFLVVAAAMIFVCFMTDIYERQRRRDQADLALKQKTLVRNQALLAKRKLHLESLNGHLATMLNSVGQGFFMFDASGKISEISSRSCLHLLETSPSNQKVWDVFKVDNAQLKYFQMWMQLLFRGQHEFDDVKNLGPKTYPHSKGLSVRLEYFPVSENQELRYVVVVATDVSEELAAKEQAARDRSQSQMIIKMARNNSSFIRFHQSFRFLMNQFESQMNSLKLDPANLMRLMHTIKGTAATLSLNEIAIGAHHAENLIETYRHAPEDEKKMIRNQIRSAVHSMHVKYERIINEFELVIGSKHVQEKRLRRISQDKITMFESQLRDLISSVPSQLVMGFQELMQQYSELFIAESIGDYFEIYQDHAKDIAKQQFKEIKPIRLEGADLKVHPDPLLALFETYSHILRNAIVHGIELPGRRQDLGKDPSGQITIKFEKTLKNQTPWICISTYDDGSGIDPETLRMKAQQIAKFAHFANGSDKEVLQLIFEPEFSLNGTITSLAGRGFGLDAVRYETKRLGGSVRVESTLQKGTTIYLEFPVPNVKALGLKAAS